MKSVNKVVYLKDVTVYSAFLITVWAFYRFLFLQFPSSLEDFVIKPLIWLVPLFYFIRKEKSSIFSVGITFKNLFSSIYLSLGLGMFFVVEALIVNFVKYGGFNFGANIGTMPLLPSLGASFATAFTEELAFRGFIFNRLSLVIKSELTANLIQAVLWTIIHVPIAFFVLKMGLSEGSVYLFLTALFGIGSAFIFSRTKNVFGSMFLHVLWQWPLILFR